MTQSIHGHEVLEMMLADDGRYTLESLEQAIHQRFGPAARFHTCSAESLTARELIALFQRKGKLVGAPEDFGTDRSKVCDH